MENSNRQAAMKFVVTACIVAAMYAFVRERTRRPVELDGGYRVVMGTLARVVATAKNGATAERCIEAGFEQLRNVDEVMSDYKEDSELSKVNREAYKEPVKVSTELFEVLQRSVEFSRASDGAFDITVGPLVDLWHKAAEANTPPDEQGIAEAKAKVGYEKLMLDANTLTVRFTVPGMRLDLGAIAKGYAVDKAVEAMKKCGAVGGMVDAGGNIRCFGKPAARGGWLIGVQDPAAAAAAKAGNQNEKEKSEGGAIEDALEAMGAGKTILTLALDDEAVATSGDYQRFVVIDGRKYSHIIDTRTGIGESELTSVTVIADNATDADALSTAVTVLGVEKGMALIEATKNTEAILITAGPEGRIVYSSQAEKYLGRRGY